jgi:hypothetical protein
MTGRKGDARRGSEQDRLMARYAVSPLGGGSYGVYDCVTGKFVETFSGRGAMQKANRKWRALVGVS